MAVRPFINLPNPDQSKKLKKQLRSVYSIRQKTKSRRCCCFAHLIPGPAVQHRPDILSSVGVHHQHHRLRHPIRIGARYHFVGADGTVHVEPVKTKKKKKEWGAGAGAGRVDERDNRKNHAKIRSRTSGMLPTPAPECHNHCLDPLCQRFSESRNEKIDTFNCSLFP